MSSLYALPGRSFEFRFHSAAYDKITLVISFGTTMYTRGIELPWGEMDKKRERLIARLKKFIEGNILLEHALAKFNATGGHSGPLTLQELRDNRLKRLRELTEEGFDAFRFIENKLKDEQGVKLKTDPKPPLWNEWTTQVTGKFKKKVSVLHNLQNVRCLQVTFPDNFSFPVGLLFAEDPDALEWKDGGIEAIFNHFFDIKFRILNNFWMSSMNVPREPLKTPGHKVKVIHALNNAFNLAVEKACWSLDPDIEPKSVTNLLDLRQSWFKDDAPRIIHFSTHYTYDTKAPNTYWFTLSPTEIFSAQVLTRWNEDEPVKKAFFFLNVCSGGVIPAPGYNNALTDFFPRYSLGFIATIYDLFDVSAGDMSQRFYELFIGENMPILDAFSQAKLKLVLSEKKYAALGYLMWQVDPLLVYSYRKKNGKKNGKKIAP